MKVPHLDRLYRGLSTALAPAQLLAQCVHPKLRQPFDERLGMLPLPEGSPRIAFHAASAGDVRSVLPVARALHERAPGAALHVWVQTRSGRAMAERELNGLATWSATPLEGWPWAERAMARVQPDVVVLELLELWPGLLRAARRQGARILVMNGRLSRRQRGWYARRFFAERIRALEGVMARSPEDARAFEALRGDPVPWCLPTKHAGLSVPEPDEVARLRARHGLEGWKRADTWIAGSVHEAERAMLCEAAGRLERRVIVVPRYVEHGRRWAESLRARGLRVRRSPVEPRTGDVDAVVIETMGELAGLYGCARVAWIGGTSGGRGGQNPLEAAVAGCRVVVGPAAEQIEAELAWLEGVVRAGEGGAAEAVRALDVAWEMKAARGGEALVEGARAGVEGVADWILSEVGFVVECV